MSEEMLYMLTAFVPVAVMLVLGLLSQMITGVLCKKLAGRKGYKGYFFTGFFLGVIGLLYVIGLPDLGARKEMSKTAKRMVNLHERLSALESAASDQQ